MGNWRDAKGIMSSDLIETDMQKIEPFKAGEWVAPLAGLADDPVDFDTYMRIHNTIVNYELRLMAMRDEISKIAEHAEIDGAKHIAIQLRKTIGGE